MFITEFNRKLSFLISNSFGNTRESLEQLKAAAEKTAFLFVPDFYSTSHNVMETQKAFSMF